jgi:hypothetical protein
MKRSELKEAIKAEITSVLSEAMSDEEREDKLQQAKRGGGKEKPLRKLAAIGKKEDQSKSSSLIGRMGDRSLKEDDLEEVYQTNSKMSQIVSLFQDMMDDEYDGIDYRKALNDVIKAIDDDYKAAEKEGEKFSRIREEDEPTDAEIKKADSVASAANKLQKLVKKMKDKAKDFKAAEGKAKEKIKDELKVMTAEKKKLEKSI